MPTEKKVAGALDRHSPTGDGCSSSKARSGQREQDAPATLLPELRFPEFQGDDNWKERPLRYFLKEHKKKSDGECEVHSVSVHKGVVNQKEHLGRSFAAKDTSNYNLAHPHDVIYTKSPTGDFAYGVVKQNHLKFNVIVSPLYGVFTPVTPSAGYIIHCFFESPQRAYKYLDPITQKGAKNTIQITNQGFLSGMVLFPHSPAEQQKIADCLGSLDDLIAAHSRKLAALQDHKKGLLQQLFPAEGETTPKRRFPEFEGVWEPFTVDDLLKSLPTRGHQIPSSEIKKIGSYPVIDQGKEPVAGYCDNHDLLCRKHPVIVFGDHTTIVKFIDFNFIVGADGTKLLIKRRKTDLMMFLSFALENYKMAQEGYKRHFSILRNILIPTPTPAEQQKIADCLSALDALITTQIEQIAALKAHKKGLMQKLFPNPEFKKA